MLKNRELSVEKIGTFVLTNPGADEKVIHPQFIGFQFNRKAETDEALIDFIVAETGKSKTLISSDLGSLFEDIRQYANLGKVYSFANLGMISLNRLGEYEFVAGHGNISVSDAGPGTKVVTEGSSKQQASRNVVIFIAFLIVILIAGALGWGIYKYIGQKKTDTVQADTPANKIDTNAVQNKPDTAAITQKQPATIKGMPTDSSYFKFIFETTENRARAYRRFDTLRSYKDPVKIDSIKSDSSMIYHLYIGAKIAVRDTAYVRDSIQKYFQRTIKIEH